jgi:AmmeMemoRadiSam system protein B
MPSLRPELDLMPSPSPEQPGLLIRDPFGYSPAMLVIPDGLVPLLQFFDGATSELDARHQLVQATKDVRAGEVLDQLRQALEEAGFLTGDRFEAMREDKHRQFREQPLRLPSHAGPGGYPEDSAAVRETFADYFRGQRPEPRDSTVAIAAPHASPPAAWASYASAFSAIPRSAGEKTFVILGTSHYGEPDRFGLTRKPFLTPLGETTPDLALIDRLEQRGGAAVKMEDYCHAAEHSIEFQVVFLQYLFGPNIKVLPILCGSFARSIYQGGRPEENEAVQQFLAELAEVGQARANDLFWVLGVDMAHMGHRYQDEVRYQAGFPEMEPVRVRDQQRIESILARDGGAFWEQVQENQDDLKWCGSSPFYTFLKAGPAGAGELLSYEQWEIDEASVVTFGGLRFG